VTKENTGEQTHVHCHEPVSREKRFRGRIEKVWLGRDSYLDGVPGFLEFHLLKGSGAEDHTLYSSHTVWQSERAFEAWTKSEQFRAAHARAGNETTGPLYLEHPKFEGFEVRQTITRKTGGRVTHSQSRQSSRAPGGKRRGTA
jgi:heme-degrading monooxygenase HmoA